MSLVGVRHDESPLLSRVELLRQWQEERKQALKGYPRPFVPKKVKVRVRRSHPSPGCASAGTRLYQQGTVASRLKSKSTKAPHHDPRQKRTSDGRRRNSEPFQIHKGTHFPQCQTKDNYFINLVIRGEGTQPPLSPLSCSCPSMILGSPSSPLPKQQDRYSSHDGDCRLHGNENGEFHSFGLTLSERPIDLSTNNDCEGEDVAQNLINITSRSKSQRSIRHDLHDVPGYENRSLLSSPGGLTLPSLRDHDFSFNGSQQNQSDANPKVMQLTNHHQDEPYALKDSGPLSIPRACLSDGNEQLVINASDKDLNASIKEAIDATIHDIAVPSDTSLQSRETCLNSPSYEQRIIWENQRTMHGTHNEKRHQGPMVGENTAEEVTSTGESSGHELDDDSFDWRKNHSPNTPFQQQGSIVNHSRHSMSMSISNENVLNGTTPYSDSSKPSPLDRTKENTVYDDDLDDDSFDWRQNLSPDTPPLHGSKSSHDRRRQEYILISPRSPLDRFRVETSPQSDPGSSSLDSDQDFDQNQELTGRQHQQSHATLGISAAPQYENSTLFDIDHDDSSHERIVSETIIQINGKTILPPLREEQEPFANLESDEEERRVCTCPCCTLRDAKSKQLKSLVTDLRWRAETAEAEKHKYQNQIYTIRKKIETRITPFRDVFDEMSKLKQLNQKLLKENQEIKTTLESNVADLQTQMTEALTTVLQRNAILKEQLQDAERQMKELFTGMDTITSS